MSVSHCFQLRLPRQMLGFGRSDLSRLDDEHSAHVSDVRAETLPSRYVASSLAHVEQRPNLEQASSEDQERIDRRRQSAHDQVIDRSGRPFARFNRPQPSKEIDTSLSPPSRLLWHFRRFDDCFHFDLYPPSSACYPFHRIRTTHVDCSQPLVFPLTLPPSTNLSHRYYPISSA